MKENKLRLILPDQDILMGVYGERVKLLSEMQYNLSDSTLCQYNLRHRNQQRDLNWVRKHTVIIHYCGKNKPWCPNYRGELGYFFHMHQDKERKNVWKYSCQFE